MKNKFFLVLLGVFVFYFSAKHVALFFVERTLEKKFAQMTGLELEIGSLNYSFLTFSGSVQKLILKDRNSSLFSVQAANVYFRLLPLFSRTLHIRKIGIEDPHMTFYKKDTYFNYAKLLESLEPTGARPKKRTRQTAAQTHPRPSFPFKIKIEKIKVNDFMLSYVEKFTNEKFEYLIQDGQAVMTDLSYPDLKDIKVETSMVFSGQAKARFIANARLDKEFKLNGNFQLTDLDLSKFKTFMLHHYGIALQSGKATVRSQISLRGTKFFTKNETAVSNLDFSGGNSIEGQVMAQLTKPFLAAQKITQQTTLKFNFDMKGDMTQINFIELLGSSVANGFYKKLSDLGTPVFHKPLEDIKGLLPSF